MSGLLDTNIIVRYLTGEPPDQAQSARQIVEEGRNLVVSDVVLTETFWVLRSVYRLPRAAIIDHLIGLVMMKNISMHGLEKPLTLQALRLCMPSGRVSVPDALLWATARMLDDPVVYTFDQRFPSAGIEIRDRP